MRPPKYYNHHTSAFGIAIFGLAHLDSEYYDFGIGVEARKTIAKIKTYRVRHGNGYYDSILGQKYQDEMKYYTPTNPQTEEQQANRTKFADGMAGAIALTEEQKAPYKARAREEGGITWFNIFIRDYMAV